MRIVFILSVALFAAGAVAPVLAQTPGDTAAASSATVDPASTVMVVTSATAATTETPVASVTTEPLKTPVSPPVATPNIAPALPVVVVSRDSSLSATIIEDDGDGVPSAGDRPTGTLVDLVREGSWSFSVYTGRDGSFTFTDIPEGESELWVWWGPDFINVSAFPDHAGLFITTVTVDPDGTVRAAVPDRFFGRKNTTGAVPFPVRDGPGGGEIPVGSIDVGTRLARLSPALPTAGTGTGRGDAWPAALLYGAIGVSLALGLGARAVRRRTNRRG